jgi:hypothetical protein
MNKQIFNIILLIPLVANAQLLDFFNKLKEVLPSPGAGLIGNAANVNGAPQTELERLQTKVFDYPKASVTKAILTKYGDQGFQCQNIAIPQSQPSQIIACSRRDNYGKTLSFKFSVTDSDPGKTIVRLETNGEFFVERTTLLHFKALEEQLDSLSKEDFTPVTAGNSAPPSSFINSDQKNIETRRYEAPEDSLKAAIKEYFINDRKCMLHPVGYRCYRKGFIFGETDKNQKPITYIFELQPSNEHTDVRLRIFDGDLREDSNDVFIAILNKLNKNK